MTEDEVRKVVADVLREQRSRNVSDDDTMVIKTIATLLTSFGLDDDDRKEIKADFQHLRKWRKSSEQITDYGLKAMITIIITGFLGAVWMGIKVGLGK